MKKELKFIENFDQPNRLYVHSWQQLNGDGTDENDFHEEHILIVDPSRLKDLPVLTLAGGVGPSEKGEFHSQIEVLLSEPVKVKNLKFEQVSVWLAGTDFTNMSLNEVATALGL